MRALSILPIEGAFISRLSRDPDVRHA